MKNLVLITQLAFSIVSPILLGLFIGSLLDKWLNLNGIFSIILMLLGVASGFLNAYKLIMKTNAGKEKSDRDVL